MAEAVLNKCRSWLLKYVRPVTQVSEEMETEMTQRLTFLNCLVELTKGMIRVCFGVSTRRLRQFKLSIVHNFSRWQ